MTPITVTTALLITGPAIFSADSALFRADFYRDITSLARVTASNCTGAVTFDPVVARERRSSIAPEYHKQIFVVFKRLHGKDIPGTASDSPFASG